MPQLDWHPSATIAEGAEIAEGVRIEAHVVVEAGVRVGRGSYLRVGTMLMRGTEIGENVRLGPYAIIGGEPMDRNYQGEQSGVHIGDGCDIREFGTIHRSSGAGELTRVGSKSLVMNYVHISHNCQVGAEVTLTNQTQLGGHVEVGDRAVLGGGAYVHQWVRIGRAAMVGGASSYIQDVLPFCMARGNPARHYRLNALGLQRLGFEGERYRALEGAVRALRWRDQQRLAELAEQSPDVAEMLAFRESSKRGVARFVTRG